MAAELDKLSAYYTEQGNKPRADLYKALASEERATNGPETVVPVEQTLSAESPAQALPVPNFYIKRVVNELVTPTLDVYVDRARKQLKEGFGEEVEVPTPPQELFETLRGFAERGVAYLDEVYYLPERRMTEKDKFWEAKGRVKPEPYFWQQVENGNYPASATVLEEGWRIGERLGKPMYANGQQRYTKDDYMEPLMKYLRDLGPKNGGIEVYKKVPETSRFGASPRKIEGVILPKFAEMTEARGGVENMSYLEFNVWGNMAHPEWGKTDTWQWFRDPAFRGGRRLIGGYSRSGGLAHVHVHSVGNRLDFTAFSPVVRFPSKPR